jgi:hypothetical protein
MKTMTMRERMLAVVQGREHGRVPFAMYDIMFPPQQAFDLVGHGQIGLIRYRPIYRIEHPNCRWPSELFNSKPAPVAGLASTEEESA